MSSIGQRLKELRQGRELNQTQLAKAIGVDQSMISDYEKDKAEFSAKKLYAMAEVLEASPDYIMKGDRGMSREDLEAAELLNAFKRLPEEDRRQLLRYARGLALTAGDDDSSRKRA